jgi:PilZ domain
VLELIFGNKNKDKRRHTRREKAFSADWTPAPEVPPTAVIGIDVSASGIGILSRLEIAQDEFIMRIKLDNRVIPVRVKKARTLPGTLQGQKAFRYGLEFVSISADDWDAVVRFSKGGSADETGNKAKQDLEMVRMSADDADRLMPVALQTRLLNGLSRRGRLAPLVPNQQPLVGYFYGGTVRRNGMMMHRLAIVSRIADVNGGGNQEFRTLFYFDENGEHVEMGD